eukprot:975142-Prymnesium_polylepis.1
MISGFARMYSISPRLRCTTCGRLCDMQNPRVLTKLPPHVLFRHFPCDTSFMSSRVAVARTLADVTESVAMESPAGVSNLQAAVSETGCKGFARAKLSFAVEVAKWRIAKGKVGARAAPRAPCHDVAMEVDEK